MKEDKIVRGCSTYETEDKHNKFRWENLMERDHLTSLDEME
jgi:hypothetical protein